MPRRTRKSGRVARRRRTVRGGWRLWGRSAQVAPQGPPPLKQKMGWLRRMMGYKPPPINFAALTDEQFHAITQAQLDELSDVELEAYRLDLERRAAITGEQIENHLEVYPPGFNFQAALAEQQRASERQEMQMREFARRMAPPPDPAENARAQRELNALMARAEEERQMREFMDGFK